MRSVGQQTASIGQQVGQVEDTMRAIVQDTYGSPDMLELQRVSRPTVGDDDVLIRVRAAGVHIGDWHLMTGQPYLMRIMGFGLRAPKARTLVSSIGADHVIDHTQGDFTRSGKRYDLILDMGGNRSLFRLRRALSPRGSLVLVGGEGGGRWIGGAMGRSLRAVVLSPFVSQRLRMILGQTRSDDLQFLTGLAETARFTPVIDQTYPLRRVPDALRQLIEGRTRGKLVITV